MDIMIAVPESGACLRNMLAGSPARPAGTRLGSDEQKHPEDPERDRMRDLVLRRDSS